MYQIRSELYQAIDQKFRSLKIQMPFPQRDLHLHMAASRSPGAPA